MNAPKHLGECIRNLKSFLILATLFFSAFISSWAAQGATLDSYCFYGVGMNQRPSGQNFDQLLPLASVSKIMTTHWALSQLGSQYRYPTVVHMLQTQKPGVWDVHLSGSRDPFFGKENLHFLVSELNKMKITKIRYFTFDEKVKIYWEVRSGDRAIIEYPLNAPEIETVTSELTSHSPFLTGYSATQAALSKAGIELFKKPQFSIEKIAYQSSFSFANSQRRFMPQMTKTLYSAPLIEVLKEMNRNSNNHAANQIFQSLGGPNAYRRFVWEKLKLTSTQIQFVNGTGAPFVANGSTTPLLIGGKKTYNIATCATVLKVLASLDRELKKQKQSYENILAIPGERNSNTLDGTYASRDLVGVLMAKTGTVNPSITLAGIASTKAGQVLFSYHMGIIDTENERRRAADQSQARATIREKVTSMINKKFGGGQPIKIRAYSGVSYHLQAEPAQVTVPPLLANPWWNLNKPSPLLLKPIVPIMR